MIPKKHYMWGGYRWRMTGKTMGEIKMGYLTKEFAVEEAENTSDFVLSLTRLRVDRQEPFAYHWCADIEEPDRYDSAAALTNEVHATLSRSTGRSTSAPMAAMRGQRMKAITVIMEQ